jgi:N4-gp56 family major capsid protein
MAGPGTSTTYAPLGVFVDRIALEVAKPLLTISKFGLQKKIPQKNSKTIKFRRYEKMSPTSGATPGTIKALQDGVVPSTVNPTPTDLTATLYQYGNLSQISDQAIWVNETDVDSEVVKRNAENMVETLERVYWGGIIGGSTVQRLTDDIGSISGAARTDVAGRINARALDKAIRTLQSNLARPITTDITASTKIGTQGVRSGYVAVIHPHVKYDLELIPGYIPKAQYGTMEGTFDGEVGSYKEIRFVVSTLAQIFPDGGANVAGTMSTGTTKSDVYINMIFGKEAYAVVELASSSQTYYTSAAQVDHSNPLGQFASIGWKAMAASVILNDAWLLRQEVVASA